MTAGLRGPTLETERLVLRPPLAEDFEAWAAMCADPAAMTHLGGAMVRSVAWRNFVGAAGSWAILGFGMFSVIERASGQWIGRIGPHRPEGWPGTEVGWGLARGAWGKGYAVEAATAAMDHGVDTLDWTEIIHCIAPENSASQNVARRLGSTILRTAILPAPIEAGPVDVWGQSAQGWRARRA